MADTRWKLNEPPPVEHRLLGLDRRLVAPTLGVLFVVLLWSLVLPAIDQAVDALEIAPGTVYDMGVASFTPVPGWLLAQPPSPVGERKQATLVKESIRLTVQGGAWSGTAEELLDRVTQTQREFVLEGRLYPVRTERGVPGVARRISGPSYVGLVAGFVDAGGGIAFIVKGPADASQLLGEPVAEMIRSIAFKPGDSRP